MSLPTELHMPSLSDLRPNRGALLLNIGFGGHGATIASRDSANISANGLLTIKRYTELRQPTRRTRIPHKKPPRGIMIHHPLPYACIF